MDRRVYPDLADTSPPLWPTFPYFGAVLGHDVITQRPGAPVDEVADPTLPPDTGVHRHAPRLSLSGSREQLASLKPQQILGTAARPLIFVLSRGLARNGTELDQEPLDRQLVSGLSVATSHAPRREDEARPRIEPC